jgi:hypothetical protein
VFAGLFLTFAYKLLIEPEETRINDEACKWGMFLSGLFLFISALA